MAKLIWITGLAGSGKTTLGKKLYYILKKENLNYVFIDGDSFREIMGNDTGHDISDRLRNAYRIARMCKFLTDQEINVVCSTMSLFKEIHQFNEINNTEYFEIFLNVDIEELIKRDQKGLYSKALSGEVKNVIGIDLPYDKPEAPDLVLKNNIKADLENNINQILNLIS
jgi:adenylylsulfate kinase-like enzyme